MKYIVFLFVFVLTNNTHAANITNNSKLLIRTFPVDTVQKFIKKYGKDSLVNLIDSRIQKAVKAMVSVYDEIYDVRKINEFYSITKEYELHPLDTLKFSKYNSGEEIFQLYEYKYTDIPETLRIIDSIRKLNLPEEKIQQDLLYYLDLQNSVKSVAISVLPVIGGDFIAPNAPYFDSLYNRFSSNTKEIYDLYWWFAQFEKNYPNNNTVPIKYKNTIYNYMYKYYNFKNSIKVYKKDNTQEINITSIAKVLGYALYGNNITIKTNGSDLMYLLAFQNNQNLWSPMFPNANESQNYAETTLYAIWALCQFKDQLVTLEK